MLSPGQLGRDYNKSATMTEGGDMDTSRSRSASSAMAPIPGSPHVQVPRSPGFAPGSPAGFGPNVGFGLPATAGSAFEPLSPPRLTAKASGYWSSNPESNTVDSLPLEDETKRQIETLFQLLDTNGDGRITVEDFAAPDGDISREQRAKWELLRSEFDFDGNGMVDPTEFINGLKRTALNAPIDPACFAGVPANNRQCLAWLTASTNNSLQQAVKGMYETLKLS